MKKRLCVFMMSLLLFLSGCSQTAPQTPETSAAVSSEIASEAVTAGESNDGNNLHTDADSADSDSVADHSDTDRENDFSDSTGFDNSTPSSEKEAAVNDGSSNTIEDYTSDLPEDGSYTTKDDVALYIHLYGHLPPNFITKKEAEALGWEGGSLEPFAPGKCIGGNRFGNYEGLLPEADGRSYTECDIDTLGAEKRGAKRIVFSNDGLVYYTEDHYESFELLYGDPDS